MQEQTSPATESEAEQITAAIAANTAFNSQISLWSEDDGQHNIPNLGTECIQCKKALPSHSQLNLGKIFHVACASCRCEAFGRECKLLKSIDPLDGSHRKVCHKHLPLQVKPQGGAESSSGPSNVDSRLQARKQGESLTVEDVPEQDEDDDYEESQSETETAIMRSTNGGHIGLPDSSTNFRTNWHVSHPLSPSPSAAASQNDVYTPDHSSKSSGSTSDSDSLSPSLSPKSKRRYQLWQFSQEGLAYEWSAEVAALPTNESNQGLRRSTRAKLDRSIPSGSNLACTSTSGRTMGRGTGRRRRTGTKPTSSDTESEESGDRAESSVKTKVRNSHTVKRSISGPTAAVGPPSKHISTPGDRIRTHPHRLSYPFDASQPTFQPRRNLLSQGPGEDEFDLMRQESREGEIFGRRDHAAMYDERVRGRRSRGRGAVANYHKNERKAEVNDVYKIEAFGLLEIAVKKKVATTCLSWAILALTLVIFWQLKKLHDSTYEGKKS